MHSLLPRGLGGFTGSLSGLSAVLVVGELDLERGKRLDQREREREGERKKEKRERERKNEKEKEREREEIPGSIHRTGIQRPCYIQ